MLIFRLFPPLLLSDLQELPEPPEVSEDKARRSYRNMRGKYLFLLIQEVFVYSREV